LQRKYKLDSVKYSEYLRKEQIGYKSRRRSGTIKVVEQLFSNRVYFIAIGKKRVKITQTTPYISC
jgi:hypothetical protein